MRARREVILAGGTFGSPQLLQLSGIGPGEELKKLGIPVVNELPGVGKNLQDHIDYVQSWRVPSDTETVGVSFRGAMKLARAIFEWKQDAYRPRDNDLWHCRRVHSFVARTSRLPICN